MKPPQTRFLSVPEMSLAAMFAAFFSISAQLKISLPFYPVPFTLQNIAIILCGLLLPRRCALASIILYTLIGLSGIPVFSSGGGFQYIFSPHFGYILGFIVAIALLCSFQNQYSQKRVRKIGFCFLATLSIHVLGFGYLGLLGTCVQGNPHALETALSMFLLFFPLDIIKFVIAILIALPVEKRLHAFLVPRNSQSNNR